VKPENETVEKKAAKREASSGSPPKQEAKQAQSKSSASNAKIPDFEKEILKVCLGVNSVIFLLWI